MEDVPDQIETVLSMDERTDVTADHREVIDMLIDIAHNRRTPIPIGHAVAYKDSRADDSCVILFFSVDVDTDVYGGEYGFSLPVEDDVIDDGDKSSKLIDEFNRRLMTAKQDLWSTVTNIDEYR